MRIALNLGPTNDWSALLAATLAAEAQDFEAVSFLDHYHTNEPAWHYICGWSLYGALAQATSRIRFVPMVIDCLNYLPGVIAREAAALSLLSGGRFDLGIGAGDYFEEARAWGTEVPPPLERIARLKETSEILRRCWQGESVSFDGEYLHLRSALATPTPSTPPRLIVGAGSSRRLIHSAVTYADEVNVYGESELLRFASSEIAASGRSVALSAFVWDWPEQLAARLLEWEQLGVERTFITLWLPFDLSRLTDLQKA